MIRELLGPKVWTEGINSLDIIGDNTKGSQRHVVVNGLIWLPLASGVCVQRSKHGACIMVRYRKAGKRKTESYMVRTVSEFVAIYRTITQVARSHIGLYWMGVMIDLSFFVPYTSFDAMVEAAEDQTHPYRIRDAKVVKTGPGLFDPNVLEVTVAETIHYIPIPSRLQARVTDTGGVILQDVRNKYSLPGVTLTVYDLNQLKELLNAHLNKSEEHYGSLVYGRLDKPKYFFRPYLGLDFLVTEQREYYRDNRG